MQSKGAGRGAEQGAGRAGEPSRRGKPLDYSSVGAPGAIFDRLRGFHRTPREAPLGGQPADRATEGCSSGPVDSTTGPALAPGLNRFRQILLGLGPSALVKCLQHSVGLFGRTLFVSYNCVVQFLLLVFPTPSPYFVVKINYCLLLPLVCIWIIM